MHEEDQCAHLAVESFDTWQEAGKSNNESCSLMAQPVQNLSGFMNAVRNVRAKWGVAEHVDLWFRGEGQKHETSILRPALYRPPRGENAAMKEVGEPLNIESRLYEEFMRVGNQLLGVPSTRARLDPRERIQSPGRACQRRAKKRSFWCIFEASTCILQDAVLRIQ